MNAQQISALHARSEAIPVPNYNEDYYGWMAADMERRAARHEANDAGWALLATLVKDATPAALYEATYEAMYAGARAGSGWAKLTGRVSAKAGVDFRTAAEYLIIRVDGQVVVHHWPQPGARRGWLRGR